MADINCKAKFSVILKFPFSGDNFALTKDKDLQVAALKAIIGNNATISDEQNNRILNALITAHDFDALETSVSSLSMGELTMKIKFNSLEKLQHFCSKININ